jgi:ABC-2 type transport system ATP-binding protein
MTAVEFEGVSKGYRVYHERNQSLKELLLRRQRVQFDRHWAIKDLSFSAKEGETLGLIGHNGAGKSTVLKLIAGILVPEEGQIKVDGRVSALLELGAGFHPDLTGRENVYLNGALLGIGRKELKQRFDDLVEFSGLAEAIDKPVKTYSSGMYARLGFSVAINVDPDLLLIDEVLAVGDELFQQKCAERIDLLRQQGKTIIIVSHSLGQLRSICDRIVRFGNGELQGEGPAGSMIDDYVESLRPTSYVDPRGHIRTGTGRTTVSVRLVGTPRTGSALRIEITPNGEVVPIGHLSVSIHDAHGNLSAQETWTSLIDPARPIHLEIPSLPLPGGDYYLGIRLVSYATGEVLDNCGTECTMQVLDDSLPANVARSGGVALLGHWGTGS